MRCQEIICLLEKTEFLDLIDYNDEEYVVLLPVEALDDEGTVVILRVDSSDEDTGEEPYSSVENEGVLQTVFEIFREKFKKEFIFTE